jgi:hypothetical protein
LLNLRIRENESLLLRILKLMTTFEFSYEELAELLIQYLRDTGEIHDTQEVLSVDIPLPLNSDGMVELDFEIID